MWNDFNNFMVMIEHMVDIDKATVDKEYLIKPNFDPKLEEFNAKQRKLKRNMDSLVTKLTNYFNLNDNKAKSKPLTWVLKSSYGYHFRITKAKSEAIWGKNTPSSGKLSDSKKKYSKSAKKVRKSKSKSKSKNKNKSKYDENDDDFNFEEYTVLSKLTSATHFTNTTMQGYSNELIQFEKEYKERQKLIVDKVVAIANTYMPVINEAVEVFSELDAILSLAHVASSSIHVCFFIFLFYLFYLFVE